MRTGAPTLPSTMLVFTDDESESANELEDLDGATTATSDANITTTGTTRNQPSQKKSSRTKQSKSGRNGRSKQQQQQSQEQSDETIDSDLEITLVEAPRETPLRSTTQSGSGFTTVSTQRTSRKTAPAAASARRRGLKRPPATPSRSVSHAPNSLDVHCGMRQHSGLCWKIAIGNAIYTIF